MSSQLINQVVELTNQERAKAGLQPLTLNNQLTQAAQDHSDSMAVDDFFSHTGADGSSVGDRVRETGYNYSTAGENIAAGQRTAEDVVEGWMNSPGHRANILNPNYTEIGVGYELLENDTGSVNYNRYWTQVFGTPQGGGRSPVNNQPTETIEQNDEPNNEPIDVEEDRVSTPIETDSTPTDSLEPETSNKDSQEPQVDELTETELPTAETETDSQIEVEVPTAETETDSQIEVEVPTAETETDSQIETLDNNSTDLESSDNNNDSLGEDSNFNLFGTDIGSVNETGDGYSDDLTGSSDVVMTGDDAIISSEPRYSFSYSSSSSSSSGNNNQEFSFTSNDSSFTEIAEIMRESMGTSELNMEQYELNLIDAISNSDLSPARQEMMIEAVESFF